MTAARRVSMIVFVCLLSASLAILASQPRVTGVHNANNTANTTGRTLKGLTPGCTTCHGSANTNVMAAMTGQSSLYPGDYGIYRMTVTESASVTTTAYNFGLDVSSSDVAPVLDVVAGEPEATYDVGANANNRELTHTSAAVALHQINTATNYYRFKYTMPASAAAASMHTLYGLALVGPYPSGQTWNGWNHASNLLVSTKALPTVASTLTAGTPGASNIPLSWTGGGPQYRVLRSTGTYPASATDPNATIVYEGTGTSTTATGLTPSTAYFFALYSKDTGTDSGAMFFSTTPRQATATTAAQVITTWYVSASTGNDMNPGTSGSPFKTITKGMSMALSGDTVSVLPGTYNAFLGETFALRPKSGVILKSTGGANVTIIDASDAQPRKRVMELVFQSSNTTLIEGFTITGGFDQPGPNNFNNAAGAGIYCNSGDQAVISRNIIRNNIAFGYPGTNANRSGGYAIGGGVVASNMNAIVNNVFANNVAEGGTGYSPIFVEGGDGGAGGGANGGALYNGGLVANNTFYNNTAQGGAGGGNGGGGAAGVEGAGQGGALAYGTNVVNNIFSSNKALGVSMSTCCGAQSAAGTVDHNLFFNSTPSSDPNTGTNAVVGLDPQFVSATNYHIAPSSPAKGAGTATGAPTVDLDGVTRPNPPSIGAYELQSALFDFNGDGKSDILWRNYISGTDALWLMDGTTKTSVLVIDPIYDPAWKIVGMGDFNGDGKTDILWRNYPSGNNAIWYMNGTTKTSVALIDPLPDAGWRIEAAGDFNGDGKPDILWRNYTSGTNAVWLMNGATKTSVVVLDSLNDPTWKMVGVGDFNGDGKTDILWRNYVTGLNAVWLMNGTVKTSVVLLDSLDDPSWKIEGTADLNGDGKTDIIWRNYISGTDAAWLMNGTTKSSVVLLDPLTDASWKIQGIGEFDNDGTER